MGGMSFRCPLCANWFMSVKSLRDHWKGKHKLKNVVFEGVGPCVEILSSEETK